MAATSPSLLDGLSGLITPDVLGKAASTLGESDVAVRKGVSAAVPAVLGSVASHVDDPGFAAKLFDLVKSPANDGTALNNIGNLFSANSSAPMMGLGSKLLGSLFSGGTSGITNTLAGFAGVKNTSAMSLLNFAAPLVIAFLGKRARKDNLNASSLASLLRNERDKIEAAVPGPLAQFESQPTPAPTMERATYDRPAADRPGMERMTYATHAPEKRSPMRWLIPLAAAVAAIALLVSLMGRNERPAQTTQTVAAAPAGAPTGSVFFDTDQAALPADGQAALAPIIAYLQQNPTATAVVSGYHDPTGDPAANEELARNRAEAVRSSLLAAGIPDSRIDMQRPVVTQGGGTMEQARRVEVTVR